MALIGDIVTRGSDTGGNINQTIDLTFAPGSGRIVFCFFGWLDVFGVTFNDITLNGVSGALGTLQSTVVSGTYYANYAFWDDSTLPAATGTYAINFDITSSFGFSKAFGAISATGLQQTVSDSAVMATNTASNSYTNPITTTEDDALIFDMVLLANAAATVTPTDGQTSRFLQATNSLAVNALTVQQPTAGPRTLGGTFSATVGGEVAIAVAFASQVAQEHTNALFLRPLV